MSKQLYEIGRRIKCGKFEFLSTELKLFSEDLEAQSYAARKQTELNGDMVSSEKSWDGYCYEF